MAWLGQRWAGAARRIGLENEEIPNLALMGALVGTLLCAYTIAKVLRDALFLAEFGALALPYAYVAVALVSAGFIWVESRVARRYTRTIAARLNQQVAIGACALGAFVYPHATHWVTVAFYLWTGSQAMMLLPHFWVLALDLWDSRRARRVFPLLSGCGLMGGIVGGAIPGWLTPLVHRDGLMWLLVALLAVAHGLTLAIERHVGRNPSVITPETPASRWGILRRSAYLQVFVAVLALSVIVSTLVDFQFKYVVQHMYHDRHALTEFLGKFYVGLNVLALLFQFVLAGWLLQRLGLGASTGIQPTAVLLLASWTALSTGWWIIIAMRWVQGVMFQTLGKSSAEIYYTAVRPSERRHIKPAIDMLVERWSDALVGILLIVALSSLHVPMTAIAVVTSGLAALWLVLLVVLDRQYARAFKQALSSRWLQPDVAMDALRSPVARRALVQALQSDDEHLVVLAAELAGNARDAGAARMLRSCLRHPSAAVRAAALDAMQNMNTCEDEPAIERLLGDSSDEVRRAAVALLLVCGRDPVGRARQLLDGDDPSLQRHVIDALFERPYPASAALTPEWIERRIASSSPEDRRLAARALGVLSFRSPAQRLRELIADPDPEVRRAALRSAARRPTRELLDVLLPLLAVPESSYEACEAIAAVGDAAVPALRAAIDGTSIPHGQAAARAAARALARLATPRAISTLMPLARSGDVRLRQIGLMALSRARLRAGRAIVSRPTAHRLFLRELRDYRVCIEPARGLERDPSPEVRLLADSYHESAEMALERGLQALACWYEPRPLFGVYERMRNREAHAASPALEYLGHVLPRAVFRPVSRIFEDEVLENLTPEEIQQRIDGWLRDAWESDDPWLRACAVRASRRSGMNRIRFVDTGPLPDIVRAELEASSAAAPRAALAASGGRRP